jgi:hypothetical protein
MRGGYHAFTCPFIRKSVTQKKHDHLVETVVQLLSFAGVSTVTKDPTHISLGQHRVDLLASGPAGTPLQHVAIEVSTLLSTAPSALRSSPESNIEQRVRNKRNKYFTEVEFGSPKSLFVIVFDAFGKHSVDTSNFLLTLKSVADSDNRCSPFDLSRAGMLLAAANVMGNTMLLLEAARLFVTARVTGASHPSRIPYKAPSRFTKGFFQARGQVLVEENYRYRPSPLPLVATRTPPARAPLRSNMAIQDGNPGDAPVPQEVSRNVGFYVPTDSGSTTVSESRRVGRLDRFRRRRPLSDHARQRLKTRVSSARWERSSSELVSAGNVHPSRRQQIASADAW